MIVAIRRVIGNWEVTIGALVQRGNRTGKGAVRTMVVTVAFAEELESLPWLRLLVLTLSGTLVSAIKTVVSATPNRTKAVSTTTKGTKAISLFTSTPQLKYTLKQLEIEYFVGKHSILVKCEALSWT